MNIFHLDKDPILCSKWLCDKHCVKMVLETAQMLCTAYQRHYGLKDDLYKPAYPNHPMTRWVGDTTQNYEWTLELFKCLLIEYEYRYNKIHKSFDIYNTLIKIGNPVFIHNHFTNPPLCMPDEYKTDCYITSYRKYYIGEKKRISKYNYSEPPYWIGELNDN